MNKAFTLFCTLDEAKAIRAVASAGDGRGMGKIQ